MAEWVKSFFNSITNDLGDPYETRGVASSSGYNNGGLFLDVSDAKEACQLENGVTWVMSGDRTVRIYVHVESPFKVFLDNLDSIRSSHRIAEEGSAMWKLLNSRSNHIYQRVMQRPYREEFNLPITALDVLILGSYMKRHALITEAAIQQTRGEIYRSDAPPSPTREAKGKEAVEEVSEDSTKSEDTTIGRLGSDLSENDDGKEALSGGDPMVIAPDLLQAYKSRTELDSAESKGSETTTRVTTQDNMVFVPLRFGTHREVREFILKQPRRAHVIAYPHEYEAYLLYKLTTSTEISYMSMIGRWIQKVRADEFAMYEGGRVRGLPSPFDPLPSLRSYLDGQAFFGASVDEESSTTHRHLGTDRNLRKAAATIYDGVTINIPKSGTNIFKNKFACTCTDTSKSSPYGENIFVSVASTIVREHQHRCSTLYLIESTKDRFLNAVDEVLNEYRHHKLVSENGEEGAHDGEDGRRRESFPVSVGTMENLIHLRDVLEGLLPEAFKTIS